MTTTTELELLRIQAQAADQHGHHIYTNPRDSNSWKSNETWVKAASPAAVLALLDRIDDQETQLSRARSEAKHWHINHNRIANQLRVFTQRADLPKELADRLPWYRELVRLQDLEALAAVKRLQQSAEPAPDTLVNVVADSLFDHQQIGGTVPSMDRDGFRESIGCAIDAAALQAAPPAPAAVAVPVEPLPEVAGPDSREAKMVIIKRGADGVPTVWCDPEIVDIVRALNDGGMPTSGSCSGHGEKLGSVALTEGRVLMIFPSLEEFTAAHRKLHPSPAQEHATQLAGQGQVYSIDADPEGIRARVADAITGALAFGAQGGNTPPPEHWLTPFWMAARFEAAQTNALRGLMNAQPAAAAPAQAQEDARDALPCWWPDFIQNVAELPDRNSPEDEPDAMIATGEELGACAIDAIDFANAAHEGAAPAQAQDARDGWEGVASLPNCDDLIWLYCQDTNTVDGPVVPSPSYVDSWTHWAYANAPSTTAIDAARAAQLTEPDLDAWKCEKCHGTGIHEFDGYGDSPRGQYPITEREDCDQCETIGWCGPDAEAAARAAQGGRDEQ